MRSLVAPTALIAVMTLAACGQGQTVEEKQAEAAAAQAQPSPLVESAAPVVAAPPAIQAIATGAGPDGTQVSLVRARVTGNVLTVELSYRPSDTDYNNIYFDVDEVSVIDDATSQRYGVLKDNANAWMASPISTNGKQIRVNIDKGQPSVVWFKFPAPPATSPTVSINIPEVSPFDGVAVQR